MGAQTRFVPKKIYTTTVCSNLFFAKQLCGLGEIFLRTPLIWLKIICLEFFVSHSEYLVRSAMFSCKAQNILTLSVLVY